MKTVLNITGRQLAELIRGKTLTVPEMHKLASAKYPGYEPESLWTALRTLRNSSSCRMEMSLKENNRAYTLVGIEARFIAHSKRSRERVKTSAFKCSRFTADELKYIRQANDFDRLLRDARA